MGRRTQYIIKHIQKSYRDNFKLNNCRYISILQKKRKRKNVNPEFQLGFVGSLGKKRKENYESFHLGSVKFSSV